MGGGGSNVYGALPCGKIYTVFLATAGKQWSLQYCQKSGGSGGATTERRTTTVVHTELPLIPPEATERFDFKRVKLPPEKQYKSLLLKGAIDEDGKVADVKVYQGLAPIMDAAAVKAFQQWKFKPAMRSGKPVRVEILVNIPMETPKP
jgi:TonB family protein